MILISQIAWFFSWSLLCCDAKCDKAWGHNGGRPQVTFSDDPDDYAYLPDSEVGTAPANPDTAEGGDMKPTHVLTRHNKWCARECERSSIVSLTSQCMELELRDFSKLVYNM